MITILFEPSLLSSLTGASESMNIGLFHITDIHTEVGSTVISERFKQLTEYALGAAARLDQIVWAITGDVSNSGSRAQIDHFLKEFEAMKSEVARRQLRIREGDCRQLRLCGIDGYV